MKLHDLQEARYHGRPTSEEMYGIYNAFSDKHDQDQLWDEHRLGVYDVYHDKRSGEVGMMIALDGDDMSEHSLPSRREAHEKVIKFLKDNDILYDSISGQHQSEDGMTQWQFYIEYR